MLIILVYNYAKFATYKINSCLAQVELCSSTNLTSLAAYAICTEAKNMYRDNVEDPYYDYGGRGVVS
jgi:carboxypeptidase D